MGRIWKKEHQHHCFQRKRDADAPDSQASFSSVSFSLCCGNTQRITSVELALLKPPQATALILLAHTRHCGPELLLARVESTVQCRVGLVPVCPMGLLSSVQVISTKVWGTLEWLKWFLCALRCFIKDKGLTQAIQRTGLPPDKPIIRLIFTGYQSVSPILSDCVTLIFNYYSNFK